MVAFLFALAVFFFVATPTWAVTTTNIVSSPNSIAIETPFDTQVSIQGEANTSYYLKIRIGVNSSSLTKGLTNNSQNSPPDDWLTDNDSWLKFPIAMTDDSGTWQGSIRAKVSTTATLGNNLVVFRIRKVGTTDNINSSSKTLTITSTSSTPTHSPTPSPTSFPTSSTPQSTSSFTISNIPTQINSDQSFNVSVNLTLPNNHNTDYYLSGAFKKADGTRYFGLTKINSNWVKYESSNYLNQYKITTDNSGSWTGILEVKPDTEDSDYKGTGDYIFKVSRYTAKGSQTWSNESNIKIISTESDQDETLTDTSSSTTNPSNSPSSVKTTTISNKSSKSKSYDTLVYHNASVAGTTASAKVTTPSAEVEVKNQKQTNPIIWIGLIFIFAGGSTLGYIYLKKNAKIHLPFGK